MDSSGANMTGQPSDSYTVVVKGETESTNNNPVVTTTPTAEELHNSSNETHTQNSLGSDRNTSSQGIALFFKSTWFLDLMLFFVIAAFITQQIQFRDTWSRRCDFELKIWCTAAIISCFPYVLMRITATLLKILMLRIHCSPTLIDLLICTHRVLYISWIFQFIWMLYGIRPVLVLERCDHGSGTWGVTLWACGVFTIFLPACCYFCVIFLVLYCERLSSILLGAEQSDGTPLQQQHMPAELVNSLEQKKFKDVQEYLEIGMGGDTSSASNTLQTGKPQGVDPLRSFSGFARALSALSLPSVPSLQTVAPSDLHLTENQEEPLSNSSQLGASIVGKRSKKLACPICCYDYEPDDILTILPCDDRHVFHEPCIKTWLEKSRLCPVCRRNLVDILKAKNNNVESV